ncbi:citrate lyase holo-[acyl-carrier protein] synthase [Jeotgalibaca caeni]|uniref:citrate lyase holo-[acyl-carrier protein] synthase n=1 Tax=Jeotgalibaca caeni TaxID=3028623 RepID=UPI00237D85EE|nr:citrate lyase holo-[acyl-carrier protein] synthase [Jeotgalibaca caeni]MDE1547996.1 citrate lyase holo-[acyl-carrier protein] synthase [Jeotgalibaca caeni]
MSKSPFFSSGREPSLEEVLETREQRSILQTKLSANYPNATVVALKCNIPGPVKNNDSIRQLFEIGKWEIEQVIQKNNWHIHYEKTVILHTGPEYFVVVQAEPQHVKKEMIQIENGSSIGRLWDMDVLYQEANQPQTMDRLSIGQGPRTCFICEQPAKACGRNRTHTVFELLQQMDKMILQDGRVK